MVAMQEHTESKQGKGRDVSTHVKDKKKVRRNFRRFNATFV